MCPSWVSSRSQKTRGHLGPRIRPTLGPPTSYNNKVTAFAHFVRSGEHGAGRRAGNL